MSGIVRVGDTALPVGGSGPLVARNVQLSGSMPGGHGSATFDVYTANAYLKPHHVLTVGNWVEISDSGHELYEGEILSVKPFVTIGGQHKYTVTVGGLLAIAAKRMGLSKTWVHRGGIGWRMNVSSNKSGEMTLDKEGLLELRVRQGTSAYFWNPLSILFWIDNLLSDESISSVDWTAAWDVTTEASTRPWAWSCFDGNYHRWNNSSSAGTSGTWTPTTGMKSLCIELSSGGTEAMVSADKYVAFTKMDIFSSGLTAKVRIDQAMVSLATRTGLATSSVSAPVGALLDDLRIEKESIAGGLAKIAALNYSNFDWAFWDNRTFYCRPLPGLTALNPARVIVVGGANPGLSAWSVDETDDDVPDFVMVLFGNRDLWYVPEGFVRRLYAPYEPATDDAKVEIVDFSNLILSDNAALLAASYLLPHKTSDIPTGAVFDAHPAFAKNSVSPGNNVDPTSSYAQTAVGGASGTLTSFSYTTASGWAGSQSASDPSCLVFDGTSDYVTWGDLAECDFGTGSFTVAVWFKLSALNILQTIVGKRGASTAYTGWSFTVSTSNHLIGLVSESIATSHYAKITHAYPMAVDVWYHAVLTWDNTTTFDAHLYVNGHENNLEEIQMSHAFATGISNTAALKIGDH